MRTLALAALLLATACGKPLLFAEVEIPNASLKVPDQLFPSTVSPSPVDLCPDGPTIPGNTCLQQTIDFDLGQDFLDLVEHATKIDLRLKQLGIALTEAEPLADLSAVQRVRLMVGTPDGSLPDAELAVYDRDPTAPPSREVIVAAPSGINIGPYIQGGKINVTALLEFDRDIPDFRADVTAQVKLLVTVDWWGASGL